MLHLHFILSQSVQSFLLDIRSVYVNWSLDRYLNGYLSVDVNRNFSVNIDWLIDVNYFLSNVWDLNCFNSLYFDFIGNSFLYLNVFGNFHYFLYDSFRAWYGFEYFNYHLNRFLYNYLLYYLPRDYGLMSLDLTIPIF